jgi:hypothetical protein
MRTVCAVSVNSFVIRACNSALPLGHPPDRPLSVLMIGMRGALYERDISHIIGYNPWLVEVFEDLERKLCKGCLDWRSKELHLLIWEDEGVDSQMDECGSPGLT